MNLPLIALSSMALMAGLAAFMKRFHRRDENTRTRRGLQGYMRRCSLDGPELS